MLDGWAREGEEGSWEALLRRLRVVDGGIIRVYTVLLEYG